MTWPLWKSRHDLKRGNDFLCCLLLELQKLTFWLSECIWNAWPPLISAESCWAAHLFWISIIDREYDYEAVLKGEVRFLPPLQKTFSNMETLCLSLQYLANQNGIISSSNLMGNVIRNLKPVAFKGYELEWVIKNHLFRRKVMVISWGVRCYIDEPIQEGR